ncbi:MAG: AraC family transcriptional regulator [Clostridiales bacterium]|nr:AraC family transcriptional regulator [Clostridiales bacterium]
MPNRDWGKIVIRRSLLNTGETGDIEFGHIPSAIARDMYYYVQGLGHFCCSPSFHLQRWQYDSYLIKYTLRGQGFLRYRDQEYTVRPGQVIFISCFEMQEYGSWKCDCWENKWVHFNGSNSQKYFDRVIKNCGPVITMPKNNQVEELLNQLKRLTALPIPQMEAQSSPVLLQLLTEVAQAAENSGGTETSLPYIENAINFMNTHYTDPLTLEEIARHCQVSQYHFSRQFKRQMGFSPYDYLLKLRLIRAKALLASHDSITEIARKVGFSDSNAFIRLFKKYEGMTPGQFRKLYS